MAGPNFGSKTMLNSLKRLYPQEVFLQRSDEPFSATVALPLTNKRWRNSHPQELKLILSLHKFNEKVGKNRYF